MRLVQRGDVFLCASERQRDFWTGWLCAAGRVNPHVHQVDPGVTDLVRIVPFGTPDEPPAGGPRRFRGVVPGICEDDFLVLWGGGIWNWFDPLTLIEGAAIARERVPNLRVVFPSLVSPSPVVLPMRMAVDAQRLADRLSLTGSTVFFGSGWTPYSERGALLAEADVGVSFHREDVETRYSFRTRVLDYLWAGLPIVTTEGDSMADLVQAEDLGIVVPYGDARAVAGALVALAGDRERLDACAGRSAAAAERFRWPRVAGPLLDYCDHPTAAPDSSRPLPVVTWPDAPAVAGASLLERARRAHREGGLRNVAAKGARRLRRAFPFGRP
jgi:glycosyltransferase involved in cell wall biosynthesis